MEVPRGSREAEEEASRLKTLHEVMDQAVKWFQAQLGAGVGKVAREYLANRGLSAALQRCSRIWLTPAVPWKHSSPFRSSRGLWSDMDSDLQWPRRLARRAV